MENSISSSNSSNETYCIVHPKRYFEYICMDLDCSENPSCCIICVRDSHHSCQDKLILEKNSIKEKLEIENMGSEEMDKLRNNMTKILRDTHQYMTQKFKKYISNSLSQIRSDPISEYQIMNPKILKTLKSKFNLKIQENKKILITPKINPKDKKINESITCYKGEIKDIVDKFTQDLESIQLSVGSMLKISDFQWHKNLSVKNKGDKLSISRIPGNTEMNYFMFISKNPVSKFLIKVTVTGIYSSDRFLDMGLTSESRKKNCSNFINSFGASGNYSFCGYSKASMDGNTLSSSSGLQIGTEVFIEFDGKTLKIYTKDKKADLKKLIPESKYHLFFVLYHKEASIEIKKLK